MSPTFITAVLNALIFFRETRKERCTRVKTAGLNLRETDHGYCRSMYCESPDGLITEFTVDTPDAARIDAIRRADAHRELARWMAGDHRTNNNLRLRETA